MASLEDACQKKKIINEVQFIKKNQNLLKRVMAGMRRRIQFCLQRNGEHIERHRY